MSLNAALISELKHESGLTKKLLEKVPVDKNDWKPHEKSMSLGRLATHIAEAHNWISRILTADEYDFLAHPYVPYVAATTEELIGILSDSVTNAEKDLTAAADADFDKIWTVRRGEQIFFSLPKKVAIRGWGLSHIYHHRGQLTVYLRLLDIPVPGMYGPSADERM
jgi:uncharacterized damage-inducible protein DinB